VIVEAEELHPEIEATGWFVYPALLEKRCGQVGARTVRATRFLDRKREKWLNRSERSYKFDRIDAKNVAIVFSAGPFDANPGCAIKNLRPMVVLNTLEPS
jgi:hypothetical protein